MIRIDISLMNLFYILVFALISFRGDYAKGNIIDMEENEKTIIQLIKELESDNPQVVQNSVNSLIVLGNISLPFLIKELDNKKRFMTYTIRFENKSPSAFEQYRHYTPITISDCIRAILEQLTGVFFGIGYNNITEHEREIDISSWKQWYEMNKNNLIWSEKDHNFRVNK